MTIPAGLPSADLIADLTTHRKAWSSAFDIAIHQAERTPPDVDDKGYWRHEKVAFLRAVDAMAAYFGHQIPAASPPTAEQIEAIILKHCYPFSDVGIGGTPQAATAIIAALAPAERTCPDCSELVGHFSAPTRAGALDAAGVIEKTRDRLVEAVEAWGDGHDAGRVYNVCQTAVMKALNAYLDAKAALAAGDSSFARLNAYDNERPRNAKRTLTADDK